MRAWTIVLLLTVTVLAGCSEEAPPAPPTGGVVVTDTTGGVRGVVVDPSITPLAGVNIMLSSGDTIVTDETGTFVFSDLEPKTYFILVSKLGYQDVQSSFDVAAGKVTEGIRVQLSRIPGVDPFAVTNTFNGFYECAFALSFITDSCDFGVRTVSDAGAPVPRGVQNNVNTEFYFLGTTETSIVQEGFFDTSAVPNFRFDVAATPIDNACDCSQTFLSHESDTGYSIGRLDKEVTGWPVEEEDFAVRGFIPFQDGTDVAYAFNVEFQILTSIFHNWTPDEAWSYETRDQFPAP